MWVSAQLMFGESAEDCVELEKSKSEIGDPPSSAVIVNIGRRTEKKNMSTDLSVEVERVEGNKEEGT